jgi:hypothetical protein
VPGAVAAAEAEAEAAAAAAAEAVADEVAARGGRPPAPAMAGTAGRGHGELA